MTVNEAVRRRRSIRAFLPTPVSEATLREVLDAARWAPSGSNIQAWKVVAVAGEERDAIVRMALEAMGTPSMTSNDDFPIYPPNLWEPLRTRRFALAEDMYRALGIPREDKAARLRQLARNTELFGAPVGLFFCLDRKLGPPQWSDVGMYMQTVMLLAVEQGLDTCAQEYWARYPRTVADLLGLPDDHMLFSGMALGWRDESAPINTLRSARDPFEAWGELRGFEG